MATSFTSFADATDTINRDMTPLYLAASEGQVEIVKCLLLSCKATDVNRGNDIGWSPLHAATKGGHIEVVDVLLKDERVDVNLQDQYGNTAMHLAVGSKRVKILRLLLADCRTVRNHVNAGGLTPILIACALGFDNMVHFLHVHCGSVCGNTACQKTKPASLCSVCLRVCYCDASCQRVHWAAHKKVCGRAVNIDIGDPQTPYRNLNSHPQARP
jgi:hypothetical protein